MPNPPEEPEREAHAHDDHDHDHSHGSLRYERTLVEEGAETALRALHPSLADNLALARRFPDLSADEKTRLLELQQAVETFADWSPGFHAAGDSCAGCGERVHPLFHDAFDAGQLSYGAFVDDVPVHARAECIAALRAAHPRRSPQVVDKLRRAHTTDRNRPTARMSQFFRGDLLRHPPFALEDWANSVAEANKGRLDRHTARDIERVLAFVHRALYH